MDISKKQLELYDQFDDGLGGAYERIALFYLLDYWARKKKVRKILELNAVFICGVPAFNSYLLAKAGYEVTIMVHSRDYKQAVDIWKKSGQNAEIVKWDDDLKTPFKANSFDLVWNHLVIEQYDKPNPILLVKEMKRVTRKLVFTSTLNPHGIGYWIHLLGHKLQGKPWDHGSLKYSLTGEMEKIYKALGIRVLESGGIDCPPWLDTGDGQVQGSMTYMKNAYGKKWMWCLLDDGLTDRKLIKFLWWMESKLPRLFKIWFAHHLYLIGEVSK